MRGAGMLRGRMGTICLLVLIIGHACGLPLQFLPSIPGYIPVYIRNGDQPLIEINPALAEAFHESENYSKKVLDQQIPEENSSKENLAPGIEDAQSNDVINKVTDPTSQLVNSYEIEKDTDGNEKSNVMKITKLLKVEKDAPKEIAVKLVKDIYDSSPKISTVPEPEEIQFIKVDIANDPLGNPVVRQAKNSINIEDPEKLLENDKESILKTSSKENLLLIGHTILEKINDGGDKKYHGKDFFDIGRDSRLKDLTEKNDDASIY